MTTQTNPTDAPDASSAILKPKAATGTPAPLPLASGGSTLSTPTNPTATTQPVGPTGTVPPSGPATTSDPMAFASPAAAPLPLAGMNEAQKNEYWGAQGAPVSAPGTQGDPTVGAALNGLQAGIGKPASSDPFGPGGEAGAIAASQAQAWKDTAAASTARGWGAPGMSYGGAAGSYDGGPSYVHMDGTNGYVPGQAPGATAPTVPSTVPPAGGGGIHAPGPPNDVNGSAPATPPTLPAPPATTSPLAPKPGYGSSPFPAAPYPGLNGLPDVGPSTTTANGTVGMRPTDPNNPLTAQTLSVGPTADRFKLAQDQWDQFQKASDPAYQAELRSQDAHDFGAGRGVSGMHRNSIGDIATQRANALDTQRNSFLDSALTGSIDDAYRNVGIAQQQQGYQSGQQQTGFNQATELQRLADTEAAQSFGEALSQANLGFQGSPADFLKWIAGQYARSGAAS